MKKEDMDIVSKKIKKAVDESGMKDLKFGESATIKLSGLFDHIDWDADFEDEDEEEAQ